MEINVDYVVPEDDVQYRELQYIWHRALEFFSKNRFGLGIRLLQEGIKIAESTGYDDPSRLYQMRRDLAAAYYNIGDELQATKIYEEIKRHADLGLIHICTGRTSEAIHEYKKAISDGELWNYRKLARALFISDRYSEALRKYIEWGKRIYKEDLITGMAKIDCNIVLIGLKDKHGVGVATKRCSELRKELGYIYDAIISKFGNWKSALSHTKEFESPHYINKLKGKLFKKPHTINNPDYSYEEKEIQAILVKAKSSNQTWRDMINALKDCRNGNYEESRHKIHAICESNPQLWLYGREYYRDLYILEKRYDDALTWEADWLKNNNWNKYLNILCVACKKLSGEDIARQYKYLIEHYTPFLLDHQDKFVGICQANLDQFEKDKGLDLLQWIANKYKSESKYSWGLFIGTGLESELAPQSPFSKEINRMYCFYAIKEFEDILSSMLQNIENKIRDQMGVPRIGDGWLAEAEMISLTKELFAPNQIVVRGAPHWLEPQHFDAYIPSLKLAIEYQGEQHYKAIEFFGGEEGLRITRERDYKKYNLAQLNKVQIEYIRYDEDIKLRLKEIATKYKSRNC